MARRIQHLRPYICPFERCAEFVPAGASVLDVGCGSGLFLGILARVRSISGSGFDVSKSAIRVATEMAGRLNGSGQAHLQFRHIAPDEPWPDGEFDVVSVIDVMHHVPRAFRHAFISEAASRVRHHGILLYKDMCERPRWRAAANRVHDLVIARQWVREHCPEEIKDWVGSHGFNLIHSERINMLWYGHDLLVFKQARETMASNPGF